MEFEALFLGLEPVAALAVGIGALVLAPFIGIVAKAAKDQNLSQSVSDSARDVTKNTLIWGIGAYENAQSAFVDAGESFRGLVEDAKAEHLARKAAAATIEPHSVEIVS